MYVGLLEEKNLMSSITSVPQQCTYGHAQIMYPSFTDDTIYLICE